MKILNSFSLGMLRGVGAIEINPLSVFQVAEMNLESCIGHQDTANILSNMLGKQILMNRVSIELKPGDEVIVAQYMGPRLPEGTTVLPEGAEIEFLLVSCAKDVQDAARSYSDTMGKIDMERRSDLEYDRFEENLSDLY